MPIGERIVIYIFLTALVEGYLVYGFAALSDGLDLKNRTSMRRIVRQYLYYVSYNIGHLIYFPYGMDYGSFGSGFAALITGCIGMLIATSMTGEVIAYGRRKMRGNQGSVLSPKTQITRFEVLLI